jgi:HSP20 family molecular chaperone IbpA
VPASCAASAPTTKPPAETTDAYSIRLPEPVEADAVDASLEDGVPEVTVPKPKPTRRRRIELR